MKKNILHKCFSGRRTLLLVIVLVCFARSSVSQDTNNLQENKENIAEDLKVKDKPDEKESQKSKPQVQASERLFQIALALEKKENELTEAKAEIERLKEIIIRTRETSRRERLRLCYNLAYVYRAAKEYKKAEAEYRKALAINPDDSAVHFNLAVLYDDDLNDEKQAVKHYRRFLDLAPEDKDAPRVREWLMAIE
ncbi:tetratricopeptide repeat protein [Verrucomicrobiota bacterium]